MKAFKVFLKILAVCAAVAGVLFLVAAYWDKITALFARRNELVEKAKSKIPTKEQIREKIEFNTSKPQYIETIWGVGYRFKM